MRISSIEEYGLRCALQMARAFSGGTLLSASELAEIEGLSVEYVSKIMQLFKKSGLVLSVRGAQGGFILSEAPRDISLSRVLESVQEKKLQSLESFCESHGGQQNSCVHIGACSLQPVWLILLDSFEQMFSTLSLADLLEPRQDLHKKVREVASQTIDHVFNAKTEVKGVVSHV
ncbi:MAG: Rrf2 family transcriptional regulator [Proteobacteria bacterium]|nr:Rrf2 family transcriptional regulator [Pseudomonadota bacterium]